MRHAAMSVLLVLLACACADPVTITAAADATDTLEIRCDGETTEVLTPTVQARSAGVDVLIHNISEGEHLSVSWAGGGDGAAPGDTTLVFPIAPGSSEIRCLPIDEDHAADNGDWGRFEVLAPEGWISPDLDCPGTMYQGIGDFVEGARGVADPLADAPKHFQEEGDRVVQAGYATPDERTYVLLRDEVPVAGLTYTSDGHGGWLQSGSFGCSD